MPWKPRWREEGQEPDYRFSLANERTFLAWIRTALALLAGGVLLEQFASSLQPREVVVGLAVSLCVVAAVASALAYGRWKANEIAMRHSGPLPATIGISLLSLVALILALVIGILILLSR